jgi:four helix bundle protein
MAGYTSVTQFAAWQLSQALKAKVFAILKRPKLRADRHLFDQLRRASRGSPALLAEGFGRFNPKEFAKYTDWSVGELDETRERLRDAAHEGYITPEELRELWGLAWRAKNACVGLGRYLRSCDARKSPSPRTTPKKTRAKLRSRDTTPAGR